MDLSRTRTSKGNVDIISYTHLGQLAATIVVVFNSSRSLITNMSVSNMLVPPGLLSVLVRNACALWDIIPEQEDLQLFQESFDPNVPF